MGLWHVATPLSVGTASPQHLQGILTRVTDSVCNQMKFMSQCMHTGVAEAACVHWYVVLHLLHGFSLGPRQ